MWFSRAIVEEILPCSHYNERTLPDKMTYSYNCKQNDDLPLKVMVASPGLDRAWERRVTKADT